MSSIVLAVGNGKTLFGGSGVAPDADLVRFVDPESPIINAFDLCALRGDGIFEATTVWKGFPVSLENHLKRLANSARLVDMPEPNIPALTRAVQLVIDQYDDPEPGPMLRIIVSTTDYKNIFIPCILRLLWSAGHHKSLRLCQKDIIFKHRIHIWLYVFSVSP